MSIRCLLLFIVWSAAIRPALGAEPAQAVAVAPSPSAEPVPVVAPQPFISDSEWERTHATPAAPQDAANAPAGKAVAAMAVSLILVLTLAGGAVYVLRRLANRRGGPGAGRHLQLVETVHLGVKRSVSILRIGDQVVLVGQSEQGLSGLGTLPAAVLDVAAPALGPPGATAPAAPVPPLGTSAFAAVLDALTGKRR